MATLSSKDAAQRRADQIGAFRAELAELAREGVSPFEEAQLQAVAAHHERLLRDLAREHDVDRGPAEKGMSLGMRLASLFGAAALTAAVVSFFYRFWGSLPTPAHLALLTAAPMVSTAVMIVAGHIERTRYIASLFSIVACGAIVLQTQMLGYQFNMRDSPHLLLMWSLFAFAVSIPWRFGLPFAWGVITLICYGAALRLWLFRTPWQQLPEGLEPILVCAALVVAAQRWMPPELASWGRGAALTMGLGALLALSWDRTGYQLVAAAAGPGIVALGVRWRWRETVTIGAIFTGLFLLVRFVDWWWDWMPRYLFFLILAAVALAWLWALRLARRRLAAVTV